MLRIFLARKHQGVEELQHTNGLSIRDEDVHGIAECAGGHHCLRWIKSQAPDVLLEPLKYPAVPPSKLIDAVAVLFSRGGVEGWTLYLLRVVVWRFFCVVALLLFSLEEKKLEHSDERRVLGWGVISGMQYETDFGP